LISENRAAKLEILRIGRPSIAPLIDTLRETLDVRLETAQRAAQSYECCKSEWALIDDCSELLGKLRAEAAVPVLIRLMEQEWTPSLIPQGNLHELLSPAAEALILIGLPSVPALINKINDLVDSPLRAAGINRSAREFSGGRSSPGPDPDDVLFTATSALGRIGNQGAADRLEEILESHPNIDGKARANLQEAITKIRMRHPF